MESSALKSFVFGRWKADKKQTLLHGTSLFKSGLKQKPCLGFVCIFSVLGADCTYAGYTHEECSLKNADFEHLIFLIGNEVESTIVSDHSEEKN